MRWHEAKVYALKEVGRDVLGTAVCEPELEGTVLVRPTPLSSATDGNEGNSFRRTRRTFFTRAPRTAFTGAAYIETMGERYTVIELSAAMNMTVVVAELYKAEQ